MTAFCVVFSTIDAQQNSVARDTLPDYQKLYVAASKLADSAKYDAALENLKKAVKIKKDYWEAYLKTAQIKVKQKDYKNALKDLEKTEKITGGYYEVFKQRAIIYFETQKYAECKKMIDTAATIENAEKLDDYELYYLRARLMLLGKSYKQALESCEIALDMKPNYVDVILLKGEIRFAMKEYNYAIKELSAGIELLKDKPNYNAYKLRAKSRFEVGDFKGSVKDWTIYIEAMPPEEEAYVSRGAARININDNSGAISDLDEAIKMNGKNPVSFCYRGVAKGGNKNLDGALEDLDHAIQLKFDYATAYVNRAAIKMARRDRHGACKDLEKADGLGSETAMKLLQQYCK